MKLTSPFWVGDAAAGVSETVAFHLMPDYSDDRITALRDRTDKQAQFIGKLVALLHEKGILTDAEVTDTLLERLFEKLD